MFLYDTHIHCSPVSACGANTPEELVRAYKAHGYTGFILTDHFFNGNTGCPREWKWEKKVAFFLAGYERAKKEGDACGFDVFFGWEYGIRGTEFLTYGLDGDFLLANPFVDRYDIEAYSDLVRKSGGYLAQAHPFRDAFWVANPFPVAPHLIDGIEVFNASQSPEINQKALEFARMPNLPMHAGSDAHNTDIHLKFASGIKMKDRAETIGDIIHAIKERNVELIC
jgi:hypothetical protein